MSDLKGVWANMDEREAPIVTIFGAGIAGLTAAHELVERGFAVQVVERFGSIDEDGTVEVDVGGMARNTACRVQKNASRLYPQFFEGEVAEATAYMQEVRAGTILDEGAVVRNVDPGEARSWILDELYARGFQPLHPLPRLPRGIGPEIFGQQFVDELGLVRQRYGDDLDRRGWKEVFGEVEDQLVARLSRAARHRARRIYEAIAAALRDLQRVTDTFADRDGIPGANAAAKDAFREAVARRFTLLVEMRVNRSQQPAYLMQLFARVLRAVILEANAGGALPIPDLETQIVIIGADSIFGGGEQADTIDLKVLGDEIACEHGYRFFPSCYRHLFDTMRRTPILLETGSGELVESYRTTFDRLRPAPSVDLAMDDSDEPRSIARKSVYTLEELRLSLEVLMEHLGLTGRDMLRWDVRMLKFMTSCAARRREYENQSWWQFIGGPGERGYSKKASHYVMQTPHALLGVAANHIDARSHAGMSVQLLLDHMPPAAATDSTLVGPTSETWLLPWKTYLKEQGVRFFLGEIQKLVWDPMAKTLEPSFEDSQGNFTCPKSEDGKPYYGHCDAGCGAACDPKYEVDFYVLALSYKAAADLVLELYGADGAKAGAPVREGDLGRLWEFDFNAGQHRDTYRACPVTPAGVDPACSSFVFPAGEKVACDVVHLQGEACDPQHRPPPPNPRPNPHDPANPLRDLAGVQYYFRNQVRVGKGHVYYPDAPWGLSSISQFSFWRKRPEPGRDFLGQVSVDVGDWDTRLPAEMEGRSAWGSTAEQIATWVWKQVMRGLNPVYGHKMETPHYVHIDRGIKFKDDPDPKQRTVDENVMPYFAPLPCQWRLRPGLWLKPMPPHVSEHGEPGHRRVPGGIRPPDVWYNVSYERWLLAGTHLATYTRLTTMESANESGRHAVRAILHLLMNTPDGTGTYTSEGTLRGEMPDIWDPEEFELKDLEPLKRLDELLCDENLPHFLDILGVIDSTDESSARASVSAHSRQVAMHDWEFATGALETLMSARASDTAGNPELDRLRRLMEQVVTGSKKP